jgi:hypothetical protein
MNKEELDQILNDIEFRDWEFILQEKNDGYNLQAILPHNKGKSGKWYISPHITKSEFVQRVFQCIRMAEEHETRLDFKYKESSIFKPHYDVDDLVELSKISTQKRYKETSI